MLPNVVLFQGVDSSGHAGLWETDGTVAGTFELTGIAGASSTGLDPDELAPLNAGEVLFNGVDKGGMSGLWETDGTAAGTHELTGIAGAETLSPGLYPSDLTAYNGQILFAGTDASHNGGLWVTNGAAAGTHELTVAGAFTLPQGWFGGGLKPADLTVYNGLVFFRGYDASGGVGLWETDGTGSGTHELTGVAGAATVGQSIDPPGLMPDDLTVYNGQLLFSGNDSHGQTGLWESDGTVSGTHELTGIAGAPTTGKGLNPFDLTVFDGHVLFNGTDPSGQLGLWETDGTAAGTHELTGIAGAETTGSGLYPSDLTVLNGHVLFAGVDSSGQLGLWETDGTVAGTHELTGIAGAQTKGSGLSPTDLTVLNGQVLFSGVDSAGHTGLWTTDGTAAGTHELTNVGGASTTGLAPFDLTSVATTPVTMPVLTAGAAANYVAGAGPVTLDAGLSVSDAAAANLTAATVSISTGFVQGDALSVGAPQTGITSAYNAATGVLTLSGAASLAAYQKELDSVAFASPHATASSRTITWSVNDGVNASAAATSTVSVSRLPPVVTGGASASYVAGAGPVTLDAGLSVSDAAAVSLSAATVTISAGFVAGDALSVGSPQTGITSAYNAATGVLTLSGAASLAAYRTELDSVAFASPHATSSSRTITWSVNDGVNTSTPATSTVLVSRLPPGLTAGASVGYVAGATPVALDAGLSVSDAAAANLTAATVSISAGFVQGDALSVGAPQTGITSAYNAATGVLTLSGAASLAAYQKELDSVAFASPHATNSSRTITWSVNDGVNTSTPATGTVSVSRLPPVVTAGAAVSYVAGAASVALDAGLSLSDAESVNLTAATVTISAGFVAGDALSVGSPQTGITSAYNAATGVLTLSGAASLGAYQKELDSVTYASPHATNSSRTITWSVNDGVNASAAATSTVSVSRLPPVVTGGASASYVAGATPVTLDAGLSVTDAAAVSLSAATVTISAGFVAGDALSVGSPQTGITSAYNAATGVLTLSGAASLAAYRTELDSVAFASPHATSSSRTITWSVNDGVNTSTPATSTVLVSRLPPGLTAGASVGYVAGATPVALDAGLSVSDAAAANLTAATVSISAGFVQGDALIGAPQTGITSAYNAATGVLTLSGAASLAAYQKELDSVAFASPHATASSRTITWSVNDGVNTSTPATSHVSVSVPPADPPVPSPDLNIMLQNAGGQLALWQFNGSTLSAAELLGPSPGAAWFERGAGAFFSGDTSDILLQNADGQAAIWEVDGNKLIGGGPVTANPGPSWKAIGTGDFNDDGHSDILFQNTSSGQTSIWEMNGNTLIGGGPVSPNPGPAWKAIGTGDFNDDGHSDILFQNTTSGQVSIWEMDGTKLIGGGPVSPNPGPSWKAIGTGDFNGDGHSDILFQNAASGQVSIWEMNGNTLIGGGPVSPNPGPSWHAIGTDGGGSDILFQNTNGQTSIWDMSGTSLVGGGPVSPNPGPSWRAVGLA